MSFKKFSKLPKNPIQLAQDYINKSVNERPDESEVIKQSPFWIKATTWGLMGTATFAIGWLAIAQTEEIVTVSGKLEPLGSVQEIQMPVGGIAAKILVTDGQEVKSGQVVMKLDAETNQKLLETLNESLKFKSQQLSLKRLELSKYLYLR